GALRQGRRDPGDLRGPRLPAASAAAAGRRSLLSTLERLRRPRLSLAPSRRSAEVPAAPCLAVPEVDARLVGGARLERRDGDEEAASGRQVRADCRGGAVDRA